MPVYAPNVGTGFTSVSDYLDANKDTLAREGEQIGSGVQGQIDAARGAADAAMAEDKQHYQQDYTGLPHYRDALDKAIAAKDQAAALGSPGGMSDYFEKHFGDTRSQADFDAQLLGASGKLDVPGLQRGANGLEAYLNGGLAGAQPPGPPEEKEPPGEPLPPGSLPGKHESVPDGGGAPAVPRKREFPGGNY